MFTIIHVIYTINTSTSSINHLLITGDGRSPLLEDVTAFESDVRTKAHTFGASRKSTSRAAQMKAAASHRRREREKQHQQQSTLSVGRRSPVLLPDIHGSSAMSSTIGLGDGGSAMSTYESQSSNTANYEAEERARVSDMPWKQSELEKANDPKTALRERRRQRQMTQNGHEMDRFQSLEEYVRRSAPEEIPDDESSIPDDASLTDEQLDAMDAMALGNQEVGRVFAP